MTEGLQLALSCLAQLSFMVQLDAKINPSDCNSIFSYNMVVIAGGFFLILSGWIKLSLLKFFLRINVPLEHPVNEQPAGGYIPQAEQPKREDEHED
jgi:hypothetical protein